MSDVSSIYSRIKYLVSTTGELPVDFVPEKRKVSEDKLQFAPGALEGILSHHSSGEGGATAFPETLKLYMTMSDGEALEDFEREQADEFNTATSGKTVLKYIMDNQQLYPPNRLFALAYFFAANGTRTESVKLGLMLFRLFDLTRFEMERIYDLLVYLGYCEDFTGYVLDNTYSWEDDKRQELIFSLAKKLRGWGKINVVELLKSESEEVKRWILCYGCRNNLLYNYLDMKCARKSELYNRLLAGGLDEEEFRGATDIIEGLIENGPEESLADFQEYYGLTIAYFKELEKHPLDIELVDLLYGIRNFYNFNNLDKAEHINEMVQDITSHIDMEQFLNEHIADKTFVCLRISNACGIDMSEAYYELLKEDFKKYFKYTSYLLMKRRLVDEFFDLCEDKIDESVYPVGMGKAMGLGPLGKELLPIDMVVQYLDSFPDKGKKMVRICLNSPIVRWRNMAAKALLGWEDLLGKKLADIDEELYDLVVNVHVRECVNATKEMLRKLI